MSDRNEFKNGEVWDVNGLEKTIVDTNDLFVFFDDKTKKMKTVLLIFCRKIKDAP